MTPFRASVDLGFFGDVRDNERMSGEPEWLRRILEWPTPYRCMDCGLDAEPTQWVATARCVRCEQILHRERGQELIRAVLMDANLAIEVRRWMPHWENRRLPMPLKYA